jgi:Tol biopolymer transport system component
MPSSLRDVPALRLNYRYEADVPAPMVEGTAVAEERNAAVQADFDQNRLQEQLFTTILSPDKKKVLAVYTRVNDLQWDYRLDMYTPEGKVLRRITPEAMAARFPDTISWAPDSSAVAFVAMVRGGQEETGALTPGPAGSANSNTAAKTPAKPSPAANTNTAPVESTDTNTDVAQVAPTPDVPGPPANVLTFRTEQIYICNSDGDGIKPLTQNDGLMYFYYVWSPDSSMLAALAVTLREWRYFEEMANLKGEKMVPAGRPRLVEKTGRERRLDDNLTKAHPVWSPDSAKVADAFDTQVRIYDAIGIVPTQAAIPLRNQLLLSAQAYDQEEQRKALADNSVANTNQAITVLPDENSLVSFNPIIELEWTSPDLLYFETGYLKLLAKEADSARSYLRWHRLILSPQVVNAGPIR